MKKTLIALAAVAATGAAFAQSSVTLFGNIDVGVRNSKTDGVSLTTMTKNTISSSAIGFRGVEDLGGGLRAAFHLEGDITPDTGTAGAGAAPTGMDFQRRSTVSVIGGFGELRLGRDYVPTFTIHSAFDPFGTNGVGNSINDFAGAYGAAGGIAGGTAVRSNNSIAYHLPAMGGLYGTAMFGLKEVANGNSNSDYTGLLIGYAAGPLNVALATASEGTTAAGSNPKRSNIGVSYDLGFVKPMFQYTTADRTGANDVSNTLLGLTAPVGPGLLRASYVVMDVDNVGDAKQFALGYTYPLSKRTSINANFARTSADAAAAGYAKRTAYEVGLRHTF